MSRLRRRLLGAESEEWARWDAAARKAFPSVVYRDFVRPLQRAFGRWARQVLNDAADRELGRKPIQLSAKSRMLLGQLDIKSPSSEIGYHPVRSRKKRRGGSR